jgi:hypothetical protein
LDRGPARPPRVRSQRGISLVDTISASAIGVVTLGSVAIFAIAAARSHAEALLQARVDAWLDHSMATLATEARGAARVHVSANGECLVLERMAANGLGDWVGYRLGRPIDGGARLERAQAPEPLDCDASGAWQALSDPVLVRIDSLRFSVDRRSAPFALAGQVPGATLVTVELAFSAEGLGSGARIRRSAFRSGFDLG